MNESNYVKHEKLKIHVIYLVIFIIILCIVILTSRGLYMNPLFVDKISFAGMISSIILSVIAIVMSLIGISDTSNALYKMEQLANQIEKSQEEINGIYSNIQDYLVESKNRLKSIEASINNDSSSQVSSSISDKKED